MGRADLHALHGLIGDPWVGGIRPIGDVRLLSLGGPIQELVDEGSVASL